MNATQKFILCISSVVLIGLFFFPPWNQTNGQYVKERGQHFLFNKPESVPVECYLEGCVTAPANYFYVVLDRRGWIQPLLTFAVVGAVLLLLFKRRADGSCPTISSPSTRLLFSVLMALALPMQLSPVVLLGTYAVYVPFIFFSREHNWFWGSVLFPIVFSVYAGGVYLVATVAVWIAARMRRGHSPAI